MSKPRKNKCIVCGKEYDVCLSCQDVKSYRPWRAVCDSMEHYKLHLVLSEHTNGFISSEEAKKQLSTFKFNADEILPPLREHIEKIEKETSLSEKETSFVKRETSFVKRETSLTEKETEKPRKGKRSAKNCE